MSTYHNSSFLLLCSSLTPHQSLICFFCDVSTTPCSAFSSWCYWLAMSLKPMEPAEYGLKPEKLQVVYIPCIPQGWELHLLHSELLCESTMYKAGAVKLSSKHLWFSMNYSSKFVIKGKSIAPGNSYSLHYLLTIIGDFYSKFNASATLGAKAQACWPFISTVKGYAWSQEIWTRSWWVKH